MSKTIANGSRVWLYSGTSLDLGTCAQAMRCIEWPLKSVYHYLPNCIVWLDTLHNPLYSKAKPQQNQHKE